MLEPTAEVDVDFANLNPEQNNEVWESTTDEQVETTHYYILECPSCNECSNASWKNAMCWSVISAEQVLKYLVRHLTVSSRHNVPLEEAQIIAANVTVNQETVTLPAKDTRQNGNKRGPGAQQELNWGGTKRSRLHPACCYGGFSGGSWGDRDSRGSWDGPAAYNDDGGWNGAAGRYPTPPPGPPPGPPPQRTGPIVLDLSAATSTVPTSSNTMLVPANAGNRTLNPHQVMARQTEVEDMQCSFRISQVRIIHDAIVRANKATQELTKIMMHFTDQYRAEERVLGETQTLLANHLQAAYDLLPPTHDHV